MVSNPFRQTTEVVERLLPSQICADPPLFCKYRIGEERCPCPDKAENEETGRQRVLCWVHERKAKRDRAVKEEIEADIEKATTVGWLRLTRNRAVQAISAPIDGDKAQREQRIPQPKRWNGHQANKKADQRNLIGAYTLSNEPGSDTVRWRVNILA